MGNDELEGSSLHNFSDPLDKSVEEKLTQKEMNGANISNNSRYKESPSVVPCTTKIKPKINTFEKLKR